MMQNALIIKDWLELKFSFGYGKYHINRTFMYTTLIIV